MWNSFFVESSGAHAAFAGAHRLHGELSSRTQGFVWLAGMESGIRYTCSSGRETTAKHKTIKKMTYFAVNGFVIHCSLCVDGPGSSLYPLTTVPPSAKKYHTLLSFVLLQINNKLYGKLDFYLNHQNYYYIFSYYS